MSKTNLGKVSICPKGNYDASTTYLPLDVVSHSGSSFVARTENKGITPVDGVNWQCLTPEPQLRFIETIVLEEDTKQIIINSKPDGTAYDFSKIVIAITYPKSGSKTFPLYFIAYANGNHADVYYQTTQLESYYMRAICGCETTNGWLRAYFTAPVIAYGDDMATVNTDGGIPKFSTRIYTAKKILHK